MRERQPGNQLVLHEVAAPTVARDRDFEAIVQSLDEGVILWRADGYLKYINPAGMRIYGLASHREAVDFFRESAASPCYYADGSGCRRNVHRDEARSAEEILRDADRAMYKAKRAGRSQGC